MTMTVRNFNNILGLIGLCLCFSLLINADVDNSCPGPTQHYGEIGCTPVFKNPEDKCPQRYNCDHLKDLPADKCFLNGHSYEIGERLKDEDVNPCDFGCSCAPGPKGPIFICAIIDCLIRLEPGCYLKHNATNCCPGPQVCPEEGKERPTCLVDGKTYKDGEEFKPAAEPGKRCYCGEGYTGENVEPFCVTLKPTKCRTMIRHATDVRENCVPTYYYTQSPKTDCSLSWRCPNDKDAVITSDAAGAAKTATDEPAHSDMMCKFGNLTMRIGEELNQGTDDSSVCVKCLCEVPPLPTCQKLSDEECDVTKHAKLDDL